MTEEVVEGQEVQTEAAPVEKSEESASPETVTPDGKEEEVSKAEAKTEEERKFTQDDVNKAIQQRLGRESRKLERQIRAELENRMLREQLSQSTQPRQSDQPKGEPKVESFKTYEEYIAALTDYKVGEQLKGLEKQREQESRQRAQAEYEAKVATNLLKAAEKYEDFEEVIGNPSLPITEVMRDALAETELGGDIAYYLGTHPKEAAEIARLSPVQQVKAIDRLEAKLSAPKQVSAAPKPIETTGKGKTMPEINPEKASLDEYMELRRKQGARWANR